MNRRGSNTYMYECLWVMFFLRQEGRLVSNFFSKIPEGINVFQTVRI